MTLTVVACVCCASAASTQDRSVQHWTMSARLGGGFFAAADEWSISHPYYSGNSVVWETFTGTVRHDLHLEGSFELRRGYLGLRGTLGVIPQEFTQDNPATEQELSLLLAGLSVVLYPAAAAATSVEPFVLLGAGGQKATGDMDNTGFYLSCAAGLDAQIASHLAVDVGIQLWRLKYTQITPAPAIAKDVAVTPMSVFLGTRIGR